VPDSPEDSHAITERQRNRVNPNLMMIFILNSKK